MLMRHWQKKAVNLPICSVCSVVKTGNLSGALVCVPKSWMLPNQAAGLQYRRFCLLCALLLLVPLLSPESCAVAV